MVLLVEKQKPLERALEVSNRGLAEAKKAWASLLDKFYEAQQPCSLGNIIAFSYLLSVHYRLIALFLTPNY